MNRRYYLHRRNGIWYAELVGDDGRRMSARSTGTRDRDEANLAVALWLRDGLPAVAGGKPRSPEQAADFQGLMRTVKKLDIGTEEALAIVSALRDRGLVDFAVTKPGPGKRDLCAFLAEFWDYDKSPYVREKLAHGQGIGKRHCYESAGRVRLYWEPAFAGRPMSGVTRRELKDFSLSLAERGLSPASANRILVCGTTAFRWAAREGIIPSDPSAGLMRFSGAAEKRGVLAPHEAAALFRAGWKENRARAASLLACTSGLRSGEVLAVRKSDIDPGKPVLYVRHSWSLMDGLKSPKNGEKRRVPLLPEVKKELLELLAENPHRTDDPFVFYGLLPDRPMDGKLLLSGLHDACASIGIDHAARNIVFHSWRHYYAARMADRGTAEKVSRVTGHKSLTVFEEYADHVLDENLEEMAGIGAEVFGNVLMFRGA